VISRNGDNKESGPLTRMLGVITSPRATFKEIAKRPSFFAPLIVIIGFFIIFALVYVAKTDMAEITRTRLERSGRLAEMSPEQQEQVINLAGKVGTYSLIIVGAFIFPITFLVIAGVLHLIGTLANAETDFKSVFSVTAYSFLPGVFSSILGILLLLLRQENNVPIQELVKSNLGAIMGYELGKDILPRVLYSIDFFSLWSFGLLGIGYSEVSDFSFKRSLIIVLLLWAFWVFIQAALGGVFGG
jgi:hypothetical protein